MNTDAHGFCGLRASSILLQSIHYLVNSAEAQKGSVFVCFISVHQWFICIVPAKDRGVHAASPAKVAQAAHVQRLFTQLTLRFLLPAATQTASSS
jgi:hypothetical protein